MTAVTCVKLCGPLQPLMHEFGGKLPTRELQQRNVAKWEMQSLLSCNSLTTFSVPLSTQGQVEEWAVNNELERTWKERVIARSEVHSDSVSVNRFRKTMKVLSQDNRFLAQGFNPRPPEKNDGKLLTRAQCSGRICVKMVETHPPRSNKFTAVACCKTGTIKSLISNPHIFAFFVQNLSTGGWRQFHCVFLKRW
jgi:hypothetical protein